MADAYIQVEHLRKTYGNLAAVDDISFTIDKGEVFGLLGPNGAGKTTTLEIMEGLRTADSGCVCVSGLDLAHDLGRLKQIIGVQLQATSLYDRIKVAEVLALFGSYYEKSIGVEDLLRLVSLEEKRRAYVKNLSGGQLQRLAVALAIVNDPELVFLDEPTTGLDPQARQNLWAIIENMKTEGRTVILTTHYMEEAERLADRVAIIDHGKIIAMDTPPALIRLLDTGGKIACTVSGPLPLEQLNQVPEITKIESTDGHLSLQVTDTKLAVTALLALAGEHAVGLEDLHVSRPNLEDVFLHLTGRRLRE
ncbi:ABC transporter ATP-binding protein [Candidatus Zixiibacteriota bacterium]